MCRNIPIGVPPLGLEPGVGPAAIVGAVVAGPPGDYTVKFLGGTTGAFDQCYSASGPGGPATVITLSAGGVASGIKAGMTAVASP